jgi:hypothetical protein
VTNFLKGWSGRDALTDNTRSRQKPDAESSLSLS